MEKNKKNIILIVFTLLTLFLGYSFVFWTLIPNLQIFTFYHNLRVYINEKDENGLQESKFIFSPNTYVQPGIRNEFAIRIVDAYLSGDAPSVKITAFAKDKLKESAIQNGNSVSNFLELGKINDLLAEMVPAQKNEYRTEAEGAYKEALKIMPGIQSVYYAYAINLVNQDRLNEALQMIKIAVEEDPRVAESHYYYGVILFNKGGEKNILNALLELESAFKGGYAPKDNVARIIYEKMLARYYDQKDMINLKIVLNRLMLLNPVQADTYKRIVEYIDENHVIPILKLHN